MPLSIDDVTDLEASARSNRPVTLDPYTTRELASAVRGYLTVLDHIRRASQDAYEAGKITANRETAQLVTAIVLGAGGTVIVEAKHMEDCEGHILIMENSVANEARIFKARKL